MNSIKSFLLVLFFSLFTLSVSGQNVQPFGNSKWQGELAGLRLIIKVNYNDSAKSYQGFLDSPDQGAKDIKLEHVVVNGDSLIATSAQLGGGFAGKVNKEGTLLTGTWSQAGRSFPMELKRIEVQMERKRPQTPQPPFPYQEKQIVYKNQDASIQYGATLTIPANAKAVPAVILISGSGQQDRDETLFGHKPFWVIADFLSRNGIAVLRVDDRGVGQTTGPVAAATSLDFAEDVLVGVNYLKGIPEIDPKKIGLIGHSEGGIIAPLVALKSKDVAFIISLAGVGVAGSDVILRQLEQALEKTGTAKEDIQLILEHRKKMIALSKQHPKKEELLKAFNAYNEAWVSNLAAPTKERLGLTNVSAQDFGKSITESMYLSWMRYFISYDPAQVLNKIKIPVLALNGEKDTQVLFQENLEGFRKYLTEAGNKNFETIAYPNLNHLFQTAKTGEVDEYGTIEESFNASVLEKMLNWIQALK